jgi:hypothetical protein
VRRQAGTVKPGGQRPVVAPSPAFNHLTKSKFARIYSMNFYLDSDGIQ